MAKPIMSGTSDQRVAESTVKKDVSDSKMGSHPFMEDVKVVGPDINMGQHPMSAPIYKNGGN